MSFAKKYLSKSKGSGPFFCQLFYDELDSAAYKALSGNAAKALPYFKRIHGRRMKKAGSNFNGIFDFTYTEAEKIGFARHTFARIITELNAKGFIDIISQGGRRGCGMSNSKYCLSTRWRNFGNPCFKQHPRYPSEPPS
jgi:hypothetical protein